MTGIAGGGGLRRQLFDILFLKQSRGQDNGKIVPNLWALFPVMHGNTLAMPLLLVSTLTVSVISLLVHTEAVQ